jgi:predicted dehydrogenase
MKKLRIGLVGTGFIAPFHLRGFAANPHAAIAGLCALSDPARRDRLAAEFGLRTFATFEQMVADPEIDALILGSRNTEHLAQILRAQEARKPVLVEKPVVLSLTDYDTIRASVARTGVPVMPGHNFVYRGAVQAARQVVASGALGRIVFSSFSSNHTISPEHAQGWRSKLALGGGGALMDSGHHQVYQSLFLRGCPVSLHAYKSRLVLTGMEGEDVGHVQLRYADGSLGSILQTWTNNRGVAVDGIRLVGTEGALEVTDALYVNSEKRDPDTDYCASFANQGRAFSELILEGKPPASTLVDARNTLQLIQLAYRSADTGTVPDFVAAQ